MPQGQGSNAQLLLIEESTWGTFPTLTGTGLMTKIPLLNTDLSPSQERVDNEHLTGTRNMSEGVLDRVDMGGSVNVNTNGMAHGHLLKAVIGDPTTSGAGPYTHTYKVAASLPSYSAEVGLTDIDDYFQYTGLYAASATLTATASGFAALSVTFLGAGEDASSPTTSSKDASPLSHADAVFSLAGANVAISEGGGAIATVTEFTLTIDNQLDGDTYTVANEGKRASIAAGKCKVSGNIKGLFEDTTLYAKATGSTETSLELVLQNGTGAGSAGNEQLTITVPELKYAVRAPAIEGPTGVQFDLDFTAYYDNATEATSLQAVLINSIASY